MHDSEDEGWLYVGCDRLKDDETCWNDDGVTSIGKDEINGAWGTNAVGCPDNVEGRSGVDEDSWAWKNGDAVQPEAEKTGGDERECWPNGRVSEVEGWRFTTELEDSWLNDEKGWRSCCTDGRITFGENDTEVVAGGLGLDKVDLDDAHVGNVDTDDVKINDVDIDDVKLDEANVDDVDADEANVLDDVDTDDVDEADIDVDDVDVGNVDDVNVDGDVVHVGCPGLLPSIIEIKTDDQYEIWRAAFNAELQAVPSGVSGEAWKACSWEDTSLKEVINGNGRSDVGSSLLVLVMAVAPTTAS